jgi:predicted RNase H-like HicB family nuclease
MQFEVEIYQTETKGWIATAIAYGVTAKGRTEKEVLALLMEALASHFKKTGGKAAGPGGQAAGADGRAEQGR